MLIDPIIESDLPIVRRVISASVRHSVAETEDQARFLLAEIDEALARWQAEPTQGIHLLASIDGTAAGVILVRRFWNLSTLFVDPAFHRRGVGTALLQAVLPQCRLESPKQKLMVNSSTFGVPFYTAMGFVRTGPGIDRPGGCVPLELRFD
jgi:GNAT superfamily N-acetyltransferase